MLEPTRAVADLIYEEYVKKYLINNVLQQCIRKKFTELTLFHFRKEIRIDDTKKPIFEEWRLNERHFGDLTGYNKNDMFKKYSFEKVKHSSLLEHLILSTSSIGFKFIREFSISFIFFIFIFRNVRN